jgi:hypothetical protein
LKQVSCFDDHTGTEHSDGFPCGRSISQLEFRRDMSDKDVFPYHAGLLKDAQNIVTLGMVYAFSSANAK